MEMFLAALPMVYTYIEQLIRFSRVCSHVDDFIDDRFVKIYFCVTVCFGFFLYLYVNSFVCRSTGKYTLC